MSRRQFAKLSLLALERRDVPAAVPSGFAINSVATIAGNASAMEIAPDGKLFVADQAGTLQVYSGTATGSSQLQANFFADTPLSVNFTGERGLLGVTFDPNYASNRYVYVYYTTPSPAVHNRLSRFTANAAGTRALAGSEQILLELDNLSTATNHNGGAIHFGPDGKLYVAVGDNANGANAQSTTTILGKILRMNSDGSVPTDNPYFNNGSYTGNRKLIWASGLRNPFTFTFQPGTGSATSVGTMFINDVGQNLWEEIDRGQAGANYGWPTTEGDFSQATYPNFTRPVYTYNHNSGTPTGFAITGGAFYTPTNYTYPSDYAGDYFFADYVSGWIYRRDASSGTITEFGSALGSPVDLKMTADGSLLYLSRGNSRVYRVDYTGSLAPYIVTSPASQTVSATQPTTFRVDAGGTGTLNYQWQRNGSNIPGATAATYTFTAATGDNGALYRAVVSNASGSATSSAATLTVTANQAPTPVIVTPAVGAHWSAGTTVSYSGTASDAEDGSLPASAFTWKVEYVTGGVVRPFVPPTNGATSGSFTIPTTTPYLLTDVLYRITLTVTDSGGRTTDVVRDIAPNVATITLQSNPSGIALTLDGQPTLTPASIASVVGLQRPLDAPAQATFGGLSYRFASWSQGGTATQTLTVPAGGGTYTATYSVVAPEAQPLQAAGGAQRSKVNAITLPFTALVSFPQGAAAAFSIRDSSNNVVPFTVSLDTSTGRTLATLSFGGNLANGRYSVRVLNDRVLDSQGRLLDGNGDGTAGDDAVQSLTALYGDSDGNGSVDAQDVTAFLNVYGSAAAGSFLDFDGNGYIDAQDVTAFLNTYGVSV